MSARLAKLVRGSPFLKRTATAIRPYLEETSFVQWVNHHRLLSELRAKETRAATLIEKLRPDAVIATGDRHLDMEMAFQKCAHRWRIPVILPYMAHFDPVADLRMRKERPMHRVGALSSLYTRWVFRKFKRQIFRGSIFYKPFQLTALQAFEALPVDSWIMGTGCCDYVCVDNRFNHGRYLDFAIPDSKLKIVGDTAYDPIYRAFTRKDELRRSVMDEYGLRGDRKNIILSVPQLAEHDILPWDRHWEEVEFLIGHVCALGENVLLSLHPKMDPAKYAYLEKKFGCAILKERLAGVIPIADMFVATFSSTVPWAVLCGAKVVVVDFYGLDYSVYDFLETVRVVRDKGLLAGALRECRDLPADFTKDWHNLSRNEVFDGGTIRRYAELVKTVKTGLPAR